MEIKNFEKEKEANRTKNKTLHSHWYDWRRFSFTCANSVDDYVLILTFFDLKYQYFELINFSLT